MAILSVIVPVYNRGELIRYTLESVRRAAIGLAVEVVVVDDGSTVPIAEDLARIGYTADQLIRQTNQGLLFARLAGLRAATGRYVLFLDSDDLVAPEKFQRQIAAMEASGADVSYSDQAEVVLEGLYDELKIAPGVPLRGTAKAADFFIEIQPAPHSPIFRTAYLRPIVEAAFFPPSALYNAVAEIWFYHLCAPTAGKAEHVPGPFAVVGIHRGTRLTNHWERLGVASLAVQEAFARTCPLGTPEGRRARSLAAAKAFVAWRALPRGFSPEYSRRLFRLWQRSPVRPPLNSLGGGTFVRVARLVGPSLAARLFHRFQAGPYEACRTMDDEAFRRLLASLPPPASA